MFELENYHLKSMSFYDELNGTENAFVKSKIVRQEYKKGQFLFKEGSYSKGIYIVKKGKVKIFKSNSAGFQGIVYIYKKGDYFAYRPLLAESPHPVSAVAMDNAVVSFIPRDAFTSLFQTSETLGKKLAQTLAREFSVWINKMTVFTEYSVKERVALSLLILSHVYQINNEQRVTISISRDDFASFVGTAKESLVRTLRIFKDEKVISTNGTKIVVLRPEALRSHFSTKN